MTTRLELRDYQRDALDRTAAAEQRGVRRQLGVAATGLGKTVVFCALAQERGGRTLILAHRDELVSQAAAKVAEVWPGVDVGIVKAGANEVRAGVVVASVQTLARPSRLDQLTAAYRDDVTLLGRCDPFDLVVVDEAHHAAAATYRSILAGLDAGAPDGPLLLGVTATPDRGDGLGLDDLFDEIVWSYEMLWGIRSGYLADLRGLAVSIDLDLSDVKVRRGDYEAGSAGRALEAADAPAAIVRAWSEHAAGRRTLVFTPTVALADQVADAFRSAGIAAAYVHGGTPLDERRAILADYSAGRITVLANCAVLTEGYDEPRTDCIVVARPTRSRALYTQMVGRGTRRHPDKADCLVLDVVGASAEHSLVTIPSLFGVDGATYRERLSDGSSSVVDVLDDRDQELVRQGRLRAEEVELFHQVRSAGIAWVAVHRPDGSERRRYHRPLGRNLPTVVLAEQVAGDWVAGLLYPDGSKAILARGPSLEVVQGVGEDHVRRHGLAVFTSADAAWKKKRPSDRQLAVARRLRLTVDASTTAGDLSEMITAEFARIDERKRRVSTGSR